MQFQEGEKKNKHEKTKLNKHFLIIEQLKACSKNSSYGNTVCVYTFSMHICVYAHVSAVPIKVRRRCWSTLLALQVVVSHLIWVLGAILKSLEEQQALITTELSLQPYNSIF